MTPQIILITGASSGIGYEAAKMLAQSGHKVYGAARRTERMEVKPYGIDVAIVEPGGVYSNWGVIAADHLRKASTDTCYEVKAGRMANVFDMMYGRNPYNLMTSTEKAAKHVCKAVTSRHPKTRYAFGVGNASMRILHTILPDRWFDSLILFLFNHFGK